VNLRWLVHQSDAVPDERRIRDYVTAPGGISESAASLADKLGISPRQCRRVLDELVKQGVLRRHEFSTIAPMYCRFPTLARAADSEVSPPQDTAYAERAGEAPSPARPAGLHVEQTQGAPSPAR
jgi:hypothetical protein